MPPRGGLAAKIGDRYEGRWTVSQLLRVMREEADWIRVEIPSVDDAEFALGFRDVVEYHQVKRQRADGPWTVPALSDVLRNFKMRLSESNARCTFVSTQPVQRLDELCDRARLAE